jgi:hypothetical protein
MRRNLGNRRAEITSKRNKKLISICIVLLVQVDSESAIGQILKLIPPTLGIVLVSQPTTPATWSSCRSRATRNAGSPTAISSMSAAEKSQHVFLTCSNCYNVNIDCAAHCISENSRKLQVVKSCESQLKTTDPYYFTNLKNCATGCTENVMHESPCLVVGRRVESVNLPGLFLEYDPKLQKLELHRNKAGIQQRQRSRDSRREDLRDLVHSEGTRS